MTDAHCHVQYWYQDSNGAPLKVPKEAAVVMSTIIGYTEAGYMVTLDAYGEQEGFIQLSELSMKRIKKNPATFLKPGDQHPTLVLSVSDVGRADNDGNTAKVVDLSLKDVSEAEKVKCKKEHLHTIKLYNMCQRLEHITGVSRKSWEAEFKRCISLGSEGLDLYEIIQDRTALERALGSNYLSEDLLQTLLKHHTQLFGFTTYTKTKTVMIQCFRSDGNQYVKTILNGLCILTTKDWTQEEMNINTELYNMHIRLIGLPKIQISVTAYNQARAQEIMDVAMQKLRDANFNVFMELPE
jgi:translation initiation factor 2 alpha subunit (eIF-2alpha)